MLTTNQAVKLSLPLIAGLLVIKVVVGVVTGSLSILAQAADSFFNLSAVIVSISVTTIAARPADSEHPFGHGKVETIASMVQALVIFLIGILIDYFAVRRIINGETLRLTEAGMAVMAVSILISIFLSRYLFRIARTNNSAVLERNARITAADLYTTSAVLVGLIIVRFTGLAIVDLILALLISLWVFRSGIVVLRKSSSALTDVKLPQDEEEIISSTIMEHCSQLVGFHNLRTRKAGYQRYVDLHLVVPRSASVAEAHKITEHLERDIRRKLPHTSMIIHIEPCDSNCESCTCPCNLKRKQI